MFARSSLRRGSPLIGGLLLCSSVLGLLSPSVAHGDQDETAGSAQAVPVGVNVDGTPAEELGATREAASGESGAQEGSMPAYNPPNSERERVLGTDERAHFTDTTTFPNRAIVYIHQEDGSEYCTGWLVSPDTVVTAGHCVYGIDGWQWDLYFSPGANESARPYGTARAQTMWTDVTWANDFSDDQDWGIVKLDRSFPEVGYFGYRWQSDSYDGTEVQLRGYPADKDPGQLWGMGGPIAQSEEFKLWYEMDTFGGQSGSPVFLGDRNVSVSIHTGYSGSPGYNRSVRITESLFNIITGVR